MACSGCVDMDQHHWQDRVILLFAADNEDEHYKAMRQQLDDEVDGVKDRDLVIYELFFDQSDGTAEATAEAWNVESAGFTYLLIGKDGRVKARSEKAVAVESIFRQIDSMPMRQREMRR